MKKAIVIRAFSGSSDFLGSAQFLETLEDYQRVFASAKERGFEGIQPYIELDAGFLSLKTPDAELKAIAKAAKDAGIALPSLEIAPLQYSFTSDDAEERARGIEVVRRAIEVAKIMDVKGLLVIPGYVGLPWLKGGGNPVLYEHALDRTRDALRALAPHAEAQGVTVYLENIWNMFLLSPLEMRQLIDDVGSPNVGVLLDTGNVTQFGFAEQWIRILGPRIREIHFKDFRRAVGTVEGFVPLLAGDVNWPAVMAALKDTGFNGYVIAETFPYETEGDMMLTHISATLDRLLKGA